VGLDALELLLGLMLAKAVPDSGDEARRVVVDAEDYRARRHLGLLQKTYVMAGEAMTLRRSQSIPQLSAAERHLVREAVEPLAGVRALTEGSGALRNVTIIPVAAGAPDDRAGRESPGTRNGRKAGESEEG
jgi:predicted RNA-binding protein Jag